MPSGGYLIDKHFDDIFGVDLKSNPIKRPQNYAQNVKNTIYDGDDTLVKRKGGKIVSEDAPAFGNFAYKRIDPDTGDQYTEIIGVSADGFLLVRRETTVTITYTGSAASALASLSLDVASNQFRFETNLDGTIDRTSLGLGTEGSPTTVADFVSTMDAKADITATSSGSDTVPAAFLNIIRDHDLNDSALELIAYYWEEIHKPDSSKVAFFTAVAEKDNPNFENASFALNAQNVYMTDGGFPYKYDGMAYYRAGLPQAKIGTITEGASGDLTALGLYKFVIEYQYVDANGNLIRGPAAAGEFQLTSTNDDLNFTISDLLRSTEYPSWGAVVDGTQSGVTTLNVNTGHNLKAGMWISAFVSSPEPGWFHWEVLSVTATSLELDRTITIDDNSVVYGGLGAPITNITPANADPIDSRATKAVVYRTKADGSTYYLDKVYFLSGDSNNQPYTGTNNDGVLVEEYIPPSYTPETPRACKYLSTWAGQLVQAGRPYQSTIDELKTRDLPDNISTPNQYDESYFCASNSFYWADVETIEGFPRGGLQEDSVDTGFGDVVAGIAPNKDSFFVFKDRSMALYTGEVGLNNVRKEILESDSGLAAHATIQDVGGMLVWLDPVYGFKSVVAGRLPVSIGPQVDTIVKQNPRSGESRLNLKRAIALNFDLEDKYICFIPAESLSGTDRYANSNSKILVYDYEEIKQNQYRNGWHVWTGLNMQGGIVVEDDELFWTERKLLSSTIRYDHWKRSSLNDPWDYEDHNAAIDWEWFGGWLHYQTPGIDKQFIKLLIHSLKDSQTDGFVLTIEQYGNFISTQLLSTAEDILFEFTGSDIKRTKLIGLPQNKLSSLALKFKNSEHQQNVQITGWEVEVEEEYGMEILP